MTFTDGVQDGYPSIYQGRDNGVMYWGDFFKQRMKVSAGAFDGKSATGHGQVLGAARVQFDFWDKEDGYYLNGTYYGDKNLLALGGATQYQDGRTASTIDFLLEKKLPNGGVISRLKASIPTTTGWADTTATYAKSQGAYGTCKLPLSESVAIGKLHGKFELLGKYAKADFTHGTGANYDQKTTEVNFNYVIKQFNARVMSFYQQEDFNTVKTDTWQAGIGLQIQI